MHIFTRIAAVLALVAAGLAACCFLAPVSSTYALVNLERWSAGLERKQVTLADGLTFVYLEGGQGEPLVLLHGFGVNKDTFTRVAKHLTSRYRVIIPDLIGFGESSRPADAHYDMSAQSERVSRFLQAVHASPAHLGGSSMGGQIALACAQTHPEDVHSLWLLDASGVVSGPHSALELRLVQGKNPLLPTTQEEFDALFELAFTHRPFVPSFVRRVFAQEQIGRHALEERIFKECWRPDAKDPLVTNVAVPTLIVWGQEDRVIHPGKGSILHGLLPRSALIVMPGVGHAPMIEAPAQCAADYLRFRANPPRAQ
ncbi:MAG TPA: alpha/beta hydrolase [Polyangiales bacterium]